jgi:hypothetical protein
MESFAILGKCEDERLEVELEPYILWRRGWYLCDNSRTYTAPVASLRHSRIRPAIVGIPRTYAVGLWMLEPKDLKLSAADGVDRDVMVVFEGSCVQCSYYFISLHVELAPERSAVRRGTRGKRLGMIEV